MPACLYYAMYLNFEVVFGILFFTECVLKDCGPQVHVHASTSWWCKYVARCQRGPLRRGVGERAWCACIVNHLEFGWLYLPRISSVYSCISIEISYTIFIITKHHVSGVGNKEAPGASAPPPVSSVSPCSQISKTLGKFSQPSIVTQISYLAWLWVKCASIAAKCILLDLQFVSSSPRSCKNGRGLTQSRRGHKNLRALRAQLFIQPPNLQSFSIFLHLCTWLVGAM